MDFLAFLVLGVRAVVRSRHRSGTVYALVLGLGNAVLTVYVLFCLLWGANYYADSFTDKSGIDVEPVAVDDLERVTRQFAALVNEYAGDIPPRRRRRLCRRPRGDPRLRAEDLRKSL